MSEVSMVKKLKENIRKAIVTSDEAIKILGITRARLSQLKKSGKLMPITKNVYSLEDIQNRHNIQESLRKKYYKPKKDKFIKKG